jgi:hypothetical protein
MFERYNLENLRRVLQNPRDLYLEFLLLNGWFYRQIAPNDRIDVVTHNWDNLVILDACRYDTFARISDISGRLERAVSPGAASWEFLQESFVGRELHDTVYVTANPHAYKIPDGTFHRHVNLLDGAWDDDLRTVPPDRVVEATLELHEQCPNKRLVIHFMQPHYPFIGSHNPGSYGGIEMHLSEEERSNYPSPWTMLLGPFSDGAEEMVSAYEENLRVVLPHVERLLETLDGRSVVTADHGNLLGERTFPIPVRGYGHPKRVHHPKLIEVPWHVVEGDRRDITTDPPEGREQIDDATVTDRLRDLGYRA